MSGRKRVNGCLLWTLVKSAYQKIYFLISQPKHMLWVLKRNETVLLSTQNICLKFWVRKYLQFYAKFFCLSKPVLTFLSKTLLNYFNCLLHLFCVCHIELYGNESVRTLTHQLLFTLRTFVETSSKHMISNVVKFLCQSMANACITTWKATRITL